MVSLLLPPESTPSLYAAATSVARPNRHSMAPSATHNYDLAMQEYMDLKFIRDELCNHILQLRPNYLSMTTSNGSALSSPDTSPTRERSSRSPSLRRHRKAHARCSGFDEASETLDTIPDEETLEEISTEEKRLFDIDESIKRALTELLNCESVRSDRSMRLWVQSRLMETEKELRSGRRRRSSATD